MRGKVIESYGSRCFFQLKALTEYIKISYLLKYQHFLQSVCHFKKI